MFNDPTGLAPEKEKGAKGDKLATPLDVNLGHGETIKNIIYDYNNGCTYVIIQFAGNASPLGPEVGFRMETIAFGGGGGMNSNFGSETGSEGSPSPSMGESNGMPHKMKGTGASGVGGGNGGGGGFTWEGQRRAVTGTERKYGSEVVNSYKYWHDGGWVSGNDYFGAVNNLAKNFFSEDYDMASDGFSSESFNSAVFMNDLIPAVFNYWKYKMRLPDGSLNPLFVGDGLISNDMDLLMIGGLAGGFAKAIFRGIAKRIASLTVSKGFLKQLRTKKSTQKQARHLLGTAGEGKGYLNSMDDAQAVLDAVHSGNAKFLGTTKTGHKVFKYEGVTGINVNLGRGITGQPTNVFIIKGTTSPSVVPTNPFWKP